MKPILAVLAGVMAVGSQSAAAQDFELTRTVAQGTRFVLRNIIGTVNIDAGSGRTLTVTARKKAGSKGKRAA